MQWIFHIEILLTMYNAFFLAHLNYCILFWGGATNIICRLQTKAERAIASAGYNTQLHFLKCRSLLKIEGIYELH